MTPGIGCRHIRTSPSCSILA